MRNMTKPTIYDVISVMSGSLCQLQNALLDKNLEAEPQFYTLRNRFCKARFKEKFLGNDDEIENWMNPPPKILGDHWELCEKNIANAMKELGITFKDGHVKIQTNELGEIMIDAIGSTRENENVIFKIGFGGSWKTVYGHELVQKMGALLKYGDKPFGKEISIQDINLIVIISGSKDPSKVIRIIPKESVYTKKGDKIKTKGWDVLDKEFKETLKETLDIFKEIESKNIEELETNPLPMNCMTCPFHNFKFEINGNNLTCVGFLKMAST